MHKRLLFAALLIFSAAALTAQCSVSISQTPAYPVCGPFATLTANPASSGNALDFGGADDYVSFAGDLSAVTSFTYEAWIFVRARQNWERLIDFGNAAGQSTLLAASIGNTGVPAFYIQTPNGEQSFSAPGPLPLNVWTHVALTLDGQTAKMYFNGVVVAQNNNFTYTPSLLGPTVNNWLGRSQYADAYFNGLMEEVRLWNVARTQAEIQANMFTQINGAPAGLIARFGMNQGVAYANNAGVNTVINDQGDVAYNGALNNFDLNGNTSNWVDGLPFNVAYSWSNGDVTQTITPNTDGVYSVTITAPNGCTASTAYNFVYDTIPAINLVQATPDPVCGAPAIVALAPGPMGNALDFDGSDDYMDLTSMQGIADFTLEYWLFPRSPDDGIDRITSTNGDVFETAKNGDGTIYFYGLGNNWTYVTTAPLNQWSHLAFVRDGSQMKAYMNGIEVGTYNVGGNILPGHWNIGRRLNGGGSEYANMRLDGFRVWNQARTPAEIMADMGADIVGAPAGLMVNFEMNQGIPAANNAGINVATNAQGNPAREGRLFNFALSGGRSNWVEHTQFPLSYAWSNGSTLASMSAGISGTYSVTVNGGAGCTTSASISVTVLPPASVTISKRPGYCSNMAIGANPTGTGPFSYLWSNGETTQTMTPATPGDYRVTITDSNGCTAANTFEAMHIDAQIEVFPPGPLCGANATLRAITGSEVRFRSDFVNGQAPPQSVCDDWNTFRASLIKTYANMRMYSNLNQGYVLNNLVTTNGIATALRNGTDADLYFGADHFHVGDCGGTELTINNGMCNCDDGYAIRPCVGYEIWGGVNGLTCFAPSQTITVEFGRSGYLYTWSNGANTPSINVSASGTYSVTITDSQLCTAVATTTIQFNQPVATSLSESICSGDSYLFGAQALTQPGTYRDTLAAASGCDSIVTLQLSVTPLPTPSIAQNGAGLETGLFEQYQWYLDGNVLNGDTSQTYSPTQDGNYTVVVTDANGCTAESAAFEVTFTDAGQLQGRLTPKVYVNLATNALTIEWRSPTEAILYNAIGEQVYQASVTAPRSQLDLSFLSSGVYYLQLSDGQALYSHKILLQKP